MTALLRAEHLFCTLPSSDGERVLFRDLSLQVESGEIVDLTGPSGSGKSSLLTALAQLNPHASGDLALQGRPHPPSPRSSGARRSPICRSRPS